MTGELILYFILEGLGNIHMYLGTPVERKTRRVKESRKQQHTGHVFGVKHLIASTSSLTYVG